MDYLLYIDTPPANNEDNPKKTTLKLSRGRLTGGFLYFPRGPSGYLHFEAYIATWKILPYNKDETYRLNGCVVPLYLNIDFFEPPFLIDCITWNDSKVYDHVLTVGFFLDPYAKPRKSKGIVKSIYDATLGYKTGGDRKT